MGNGISGTVSRDLNTPKESALQHLHLITWNRHSAERDGVVFSLVNLLPTHTSTLLQPTDYRAGLGGPVSLFRLLRHLPSWEQLLRHVAPRFRAVLDVHAPPPHHDVPPHAAADPVAHPPAA